LGFTQLFLSSRLVFVEDRLPAMRHIDDREAPVPQSQSTLEVTAGAVRTAMCDGDWLREIEEFGNPAHEAPLILAANETQQIRRADHSGGRRRALWNIREPICSIATDSRMVNAMLLYWFTRGSGVNSFTSR
jgi:hypothetical protein